MQFSRLPDEFKSIVMKTELYNQLNFDFESDFIKLYFGVDKDRDITYTEFTQLISVSLLSWFKI